MRIPLYAACLLFGCLVSVAGAQTLRTVAFSGDAAPGIEAEVNFGTFGTPVLNNAGQTAFVGFLAGTGVGTDNQSAIWSEGGGNGLALIARAGNPAPGTENGTVFFNFYNPVLNDSGQLAFAGYLDDTAVDDAEHDGIWIEEGGSEPRLVARVGSAAPGTESTFERLAKPSLSSNGAVAFGGILIEALPIGGSIWSEGGGNGLALVAHQGSRAPGTENGVHFSLIFANSVILNGSDKTAILATLGAEGSIAIDDFGIWSNRGANGLDIIVRKDAFLPGDGSGIILSNVGPPSLNDNGQLAFASFFFDPNSSENSSGIWSEGGGSGFALVAREGSPAPGTENGATFARFPSFFDEKVELNGRGQTAFRAEITIPGINNLAGIWSEGGGNGLALVALQGSPAPGTENGATFGLFDDNFVLNKLGQTAFLAQLNGTSADPTIRRGIWAQDLSGNLRLIALTGNFLDVDDGPGTDFREILSLNFARGTGNEDGLPSGFNDLGQLAFQATFTDGTRGIFVSNLVAIPEPSTLLLGALAAAWMLVGKRRQSTG